MASTNNNEIELLKKSLTNEIEGIKKKISPLHNPVFNHSLEQKIMIIKSIIDIAAFRT